MLGRIHLALLHLLRRLPRARTVAVRRLHPLFTVGAVCVVERRDGRLLLVKPSYRDQDRWGLPGGLLSRREHPADAARRELREELGLPVELVGEPLVVVAPGSRRVDVIYRARPADGRDGATAAPSSLEIAELTWSASDALPRLQPEAADALQAIARASLAPPAHPLPA